MTTKTATPRTPADPDLTMSDADLAAIVPNARNTAEQAARAVQEAEAVVRGEDHPTLRAADITPGRLAELRAEAEHAALSVLAAEQRAARISEKQAEAGIVAALARIRAEAEADLSGADGLVATLDTFEASLRDLFEGITAHNARVARWAQEMGSAKVPRSDTGLPVRVTPDGMTWTSSGEVRINGKDFRPLNAAQFVGALLFRQTDGGPPRALLYDGRDMVVSDWIEGSFGSFEWNPVDLRARIRRDA